jgi:hypothetical protein
VAFDLEGAAAKVFHSQRLGEGHAARNAFTAWLTSFSAKTGVADFVAREAAVAIPGKRLFC